MATSDTTHSNGDFNDLYQLIGPDHPSLSFTCAKFCGENFLGWSRTIKMAFGAKLKLGFVDGSLSNPLESSSNHHKWIRCDYMVSCWILNSMETELSDVFVYA